MSKNKRKEREKMKVLEARNKQASVLTLEQKRKRVLNLYKRLSATELFNLLRSDTGLTLTHVDFMNLFFECLKTNQDAVDCMIDKYLNGLIKYELIDKLAELGISTKDETINALWEIGEACG